MGGLLPSLVREYRYDSAGNMSAVTSREDYGRETRREYRLDRNGGHGGDSLRHRAGLWRRR